MYFSGIYNWVDPFGFVFVVCISTPGTYAIDIFYIFANLLLLFTLKKYRN